jgi:two-component system, chemotaxis family, CheB/CheR fusion protein
MRKAHAARSPPKGRVVRNSAAPPGHESFPVVGLGASAGGLDAVRKLFDVIPADIGMAFILVQHLDPTHESMMVDLLSGHTRMAVQQAADGMPLARDHVYVIPPASYLSIHEGTLRLSSPRERRGARMPFDFLLRSMAEELGHRAICVILSGTGADGSLGLKAIKDNGGLVIVQDPDEAGYDGMPRSAIKTGAANIVLPVVKIPPILAQYGRQMTPWAASSHVPPADAMAEIIALLRANTLHDFAPYKGGTLARRIEQRMALAAIPDSAGYLELLRHDAGERDLLAKDLLVNVTSFFRDAKAFAMLAETVVPDLVRRHGADQPLRVWVPGCSTGEETYSVTMLFVEAIAAAQRDIKLQVFASDVDGDAVALARDGLYPATIAADVTPARLGRFFVREDNGYRVAPTLRDAVVFAVQDVLADPPFSRIDLVSCRNLLIYLRHEAQEKVLLLFHFALCDGGILFLGSAETVGSLEDRFEPIVKTQRIYRRIGHSRPGEVDFSSGGHHNVRSLWSRRTGPPAPHRPSLGDLCQRLLLDAYAPASVLINRQYEGLYYFGATDRYLRIAPGEPTRDLLALVREGLSNRLRAAIRHASQENARAVVTGVQMSDGAATDTVSIAVQPVRSDAEHLLLVSFIDAPKREPRIGRSVATTAQGEISRIEQLELELDTTRKELENAIRDLERSNEEQKAINEEAMSVNEEFQSTNEELVTSKEELQSLNEELTALNSQLQETLDRQRVTSSDLQNILYSADAATLFLDRDLNIRFFTPAAKSLFRVIATDVGRPLDDLTPLVVDGALLADARTVLSHFVPIKREIRAQDGAWYIRRVLPYRTIEGRIEGVVITFADISEIKAAEREIQAARTYSDSIIDTVHQPLLVLDENHRVVSANGAFYRMFVTRPEDVVGRNFGDGDDHCAEIAGLRGFLDRVRVASVPLDDHQTEIAIALPALGQRSLLVSARKVQEGLLGERKILLAIDDITERKQAAAAVEVARQLAVQANLGKSRFLAAASHDLRQPLQTLSLLQGLLAMRIKDEDTLKLVVRFEETLKGMSDMLNTLLDINQLEAGVVRAETVSFPVNDLLEQMRTEFGYEAKDRGLGWRVVSCGLSVHSDPRLLDQIIRNLLSNALKYTTLGKVLLGCRRHGDKLRIEVWDTGAGIPEAQLQPIFEEFHQLDNPARERSRGFGLGLAIAQRLAGLLGHAIDVRSRPGEGSVFTVDVPLGVEAFAQPLTGTDRTDEPTRPIGVILVVEDDPAVRETLGLLLEGKGHRAVGVASGRNALELMAEQAQPPDLVIADYNLPGGLNGLQVIAKIEETFHRDIAAIILTGDISTDTLRNIALQGCTHFNKPVKAEELTRAIERLLAGPKSAVQAIARRPNEARREAQAPVVYVVDDDSAIRDAMRDVIAAAGRPVEVFPSAEAFLDAFRPGSEGCLLVDAGMPGMSGLGLLRRLKSEDRRLPSIMITGNGDVRMAVEAMKAGAADFIEKPIGRDELFASIERAMEQTRDASKRTAWRDDAAARLAGLTARQRQIMDMVLAGHPSKNIAADLGISQRTIENHRAAIMKKTGSKSLPALIRLAVAAV